MNILTVALAVLTGVLLLQALPSLPSITALWPVLVACVACLFHVRTRWLAAVLGGFIVAAWQAQAGLERDLDPAWAGRDLEVRGHIADLPQVSGRRTRLLFRIETLRQGDNWIAFDRLVRLSWYAGPSLNDLSALQQPWQLRVRLKPRQGLRNPGGFDYAGWLFQHAIHATGYVRAGQRLAEPAAADPILRWRARLDARLRSLLADHPQFGLIRALTLGDRGALGARDWALFRATGTSHLIAISGLHIGLVAGLGYGLGRILWARSQILTQRLAASRFAALIGLAAATGYALLAGFGIPTRRAWLMVLVLMLALWTGRPSHAWRAWALALLVVSGCDPLAVLSPGFWLSFAAVAIIFAVMHPYAWPQPPGRVRSLVRIQLYISLGLLPLSLIFFGQVSGVAPLANLVAVPWTSLVLVPLIFLGLLCLWLVPFAAPWIWQVAAGAAALLQSALQTLATWPLGPASFPTLPAGLLIAIVVGGVLLFVPRGLAGRSVALLLWLPLVLWQPERPAPGALWLTLLDVGQGLAAVLQTRSHVLVYDAGPRYSAEFDTGRAVVAPWLRRAGINHIDRMIISHGDNDHRGGAAGLAAELPVHRLLTSVPERIDWRYATRCQGGQQWAWDGVRFSMLWPLASPSEDTSAHRGNDASCVLQIETADGQRLLLSGDIEAATERRLVARYGAALGSQVLVAPHHGSGTSSTPAFVATVDPAWVLFPVGQRNRYGFPTPSVVARYRAQGSRLLSTGAAGALEVRMGEPSGARAGPAWRRPRYWD